MEPNVREEMHKLLDWVRSCREAMDDAATGRLPGHDPEHIRSTTRAYVGGAMTTLGHLGLLTWEELQEWSQRIGDVLGDPPGGSVTSTVE